MFRHFFIIITGPTLRRDVRSDVEWHRPFQMATTVYEREICFAAHLPIWTARACPRPPGLLSPCNFSDQSYALACTSDSRPTVRCPARARQTPSHSEVPCACTSDSRPTVRCPARNRQTPSHSETPCLGVHDTIPRWGEVPCRHRGRCPARACQIPSRDEVRLLRSAAVVHSSAGALLRHTEVRVPNFLWNDAQDLFYTKCIPSKSQLITFTKL